MLLSRRQAIVAAGAAAVSLLRTDRINAASLPRVTVTKDPNCSCCAGWIEHLRKAGFPVTVVDIPDVKPTKARLGVPDALASCHTAEVDGYVIEGHVPADAIERLLRERPQATGLAVPGMPAGSPGMSGEPEIFEVILFSPTAQSAFGHYRGAEPA